MKQSTWLRILHSGDWCLHLVLSTPSGACQKWRRSFVGQQCWLIFRWYVGIRAVFMGLRSCNLLTVIKTWTVPLHLAWTVTEASHMSFSLAVFPTCCAWVSQGCTKNKTVLRYVNRERYIVCAVIMTQLLTSKLSGVLFLLFSWQKRNCTQRLLLFQGNFY